LHATRAPYRASASAIPLPMFGPAPVTSATFPSSDTSNGCPFYALSRQPLGLATAPGPADAVLVIRAPPESGHTIYDTFDDEKRVI
jgi:hypothetical protein